MPVNYYSGPPPTAPDSPVVLPGDPRGEMDKPDGYLPDPGLVKAVNAALILRQPLLLTGEPGVGKSQCAHAVSYALGLGEHAETFFIKSTSEARDLFYSFDELSRFRDAQQKVEKPLTSYLTFNALGKAILLSGGPKAKTAALANAKGEQRYRFDELIDPGEFPRDEPARQVVLIDELDKAPRDLPNDILNEIDRMVFEIPELGEAVRGDPDHKPIVVITSNSEKHLPDPFLRRCIYYHIPFPETDERRYQQRYKDVPIEGRPPTLADILAARLSRSYGVGASDKIVVDALEIFAALRDRNVAIRKRPSTSELLNWLLLLLVDGGLTPAASLRDHPDLVERYTSALIKESKDIVAADRALSDWLDRNQASTGG